MALGSDSEAFGESEPDNDPDGDGTWFVHFAVRLGDRVFDATTGPGGMLYADYMARMSYLNNGPGSYIVQILDDIEMYL